MKYIQLSGNTVCGIFHDPDPAFGEIPINRRFSVAALRTMLVVPNNTVVVIGMTYDRATRQFSWPAPQATPEVPAESVVSLTVGELDEAYRSGVNDCE